MKFDFLKKICICTFPMVILLTGCCRIFRQKDPTPYRVVSQVRVVYENESMSVGRDFYQEENIRQILSYLRYIDPYGIPREDPETALGRVFYITLIYTDGSECIYEQRADQYLRINGGAWKRIDQQKALYLSGLLAMMASDTPPPATEPIPSVIRPQI